MAFHIAIVGGGITGLSLAIALRKRNISCTIYEQASAFGEIGAGVGMHPNAVRAMGICDQAMVDAFHRVASYNLWESKRIVWFDFVDGLSPVPAPELQPLFTIYGQHEGGHAACHRARFLDELVKLLPADIARFQKRLRRVDEDPRSGKLVLAFEDGSTAEADAVVGCDGIKSRTRALIVGEDSPQATCSYSHKYAYRGLIPMEKAVEALGEEKAANACLWVSR
jgi:salicylate hydroxylase